MQTWLTFDKQTIAKAKASNITTENRPRFKKLVYDWQNGRYDEDPQYVKFEIETMLGIN
jgi:hypothetical protein